METNKKIRPQLPSSITKGLHTGEERFQNEVLRPIIKMQSDLLLLHVSFRLTSMKVDFNKLDFLKQKATLHFLFRKDQQFKREVIGMVLGHFTVEEYKFYEKMHKEINKRIVQIVENRCVDLMVK